MIFPSHGTVTQAQDRGDVRLSSFQDRSVPLLPLPVSRTFRKFLLSTATMPRKGQTLAPCGHYRAAWDGHSRCWLCCLCSRDNPCDVSQAWTEDIWKLAARKLRKRASHKSGPPTGGRLTILWNRPSPVLFLCFSSQPPPGVSSRLM